MQKYTQYAKTEGLISPFYYCLAVLRIQRTTKNASSRATKSYLILIFPNIKFRYQEEKFNIAVFKFDHFRINYTESQSRKNFKLKKPKMAK